MWRLVSSPCFCKNSCRCRFVELGVGSVAPVINNFHSQNIFPTASNTTNHDSSACNAPLLSRLHHKNARVKCHDSLGERLNTRNTIKNLTIAHFKCHDSFDELLNTRSATRNIKIAHFKCHDSLDERLDTTNTIRNIYKSPCHNDKTPHPLSGSTNRQAEEVTHALTLLMSIKSPAMVIRGIIGEVHDCCLDLGLCCISGFMFGCNRQAIEQTPSHMQPTAFFRIHNTQIKSN